MHLSIVIPFHNEVGNVTKLQAELMPVVVDLARDGPTELILVDDGSTDRSLEVFRAALAPRENLEVRFERHLINRGLGAALRTGFSAAEGDVVVTTDCDGTYAFAEIPRVLSRLTPEVDLVTASPYHPQGGIDGVVAYRRLLSQGSSMIYRLLVDRSIYTYTALFRAYRRQVLESVRFGADGFLAGTELLVKAMLLGYRVAEHPAVLHARVSGLSKARLARTVLAHVGFQSRVVMHKIGVRPLVGPPLDRRRTRWA